jgi:hypothetical protein
MKNSRNKTMATLIALFLVLTVAVTLVALPAANAHTPPWQILSWAYLAVNPNPVGVGQQVAVAMWVDRAMPEATETNDIKRHDYQLTITKPDGTKEVKTFPYIADPTGVQSYLYTPDQVGTYKFNFHYPAQVYTWSATAAQRVFTNDTFMAADSKTVTLIVQQEKIPAAITSYPLPTEYWTRPIEEQNTDWWKISPNWLGSPQIVGRLQPDGTAPNSPHIMWTKPLQDGGVVGGSNVGYKAGNTFYMGQSYNARFSAPIIMYGRLFYAIPYGNSGTGGGYQAVDLRTGETLWWTNTTSVPSFGYYYSYDMYNQHGVIPEGWLFTSNFGTAIYPRTGVVSTLNITSVPSGTAVIGPSGEHLRYQWDLTNGWLAQWNSSKVFVVQTSGVINASTAARYDWNVTIPKTIPKDSDMQYAILDDMLLFSNIGPTYVQSATSCGTIDPYTVGAISLKPVSRGNLLWMKNYSAPQPQANTIGITRSWSVVDPVNRIFILRDKETLVWQTYSIDDGSFMWTSKPIPEVPDYEYFSTGGSTAYGRLYYGGYGGLLYCFDTKNGNLLWIYGNGGSGNSTFSGEYTPWGRYPVSVRAFADGKIYVGTSEHSPDTPLYKGALVRCLDAYTGKEIWTMLGYGALNVAIADGFMVYHNLYDEQIYCVGKGPSATTVEAPLTAITAGSSAVIQGTVTDIAAGTKQNAQAARFPN